MCLSGSSLSKTLRRLLLINSATVSSMFLQGYLPGLSARVICQGYLPGLSARVIYQGYLPGLPARPTDEVRTPGGEDDYNAVFCKLTIE